MIPTTGAVTAAQINAELGRSAGSAVAMNDAGVRMLTCNNARRAPQARISVADLRGRSGYAFQATLQNTILGAGYSHARSGDGLNPDPLGMWGSNPVLEVLTGPASLPGGGSTRLGVAATLYPSFYAFAAWTAAGSLIGVAKSGEEWRRATDTVGGQTFCSFDWYSTLLDLRPHLGTTVRCVIFA